MLDLADLRRAPKAPQHRQYGSLLARYGKASRGNPPKRRTVLTAPEMDWIVDVLDQWITEIRPLFSPGKHPALFVTERAGRMSLRGLNVAFSQASEAAGLAPELDLNSLRHSYVTHLVEFDYPERFVQDQVGHAYASTAAIYTNLGNCIRRERNRRSAGHGGV
jgi:site-specific recombinase XerD